MQAFLYNFTKRKNSTLRPTNGIEVDIKLKDETTVTDPYIDLNINPIAYNYLYIPEFHRFYYLKNCSYNRGLWAIEGHVDPLASWREAILNTSAEILYASDSNRNIVDKRIPIVSDVDIREEIEAIQDFTIGGITNQGSVVLGLTGKGSFGTYLLQFSDDVSELLDGVDNWWNVNDVIEAFKQLFYGGSASECLKSAIAIPVVLDGAAVGSGNAEDLYLGNYPCLRSDGSTHIKGFKITKPLKISSTDIDIPWKYSDWRRNSPYTSIVLYLPLIGLINLPASDLIEESTLRVTYSLNVTSGDLSVQVKALTSGRIISTSNSNIAMATAFGSTGINTNKMTSAIISGAGAAAGIVSGLVTGGLSTAAYAAIGGNLASAAIGSLVALGGEGNGSGGLGGGSSHGLDSVIHLFTINHTLSDEQTYLAPVMGKPFFKVDTINNHRGFIQCDGFKMSGTALYLSEIEEIENFMNSGVYLEL